MYCKYVSKNCCFILNELVNVWICEFIGSMSHTQWNIHIYNHVYSSMLTYIGLTTWQCIIDLWLVHDHKVTHTSPMHVAVTWITIDIKEKGFSLLRWRHGMFMWISLCAFGWSWMSNPTWVRKMFGWVMYIHELIRPMHAFMESCISMNDCG